MKNSNSKERIKLLMDHFCINQTELCKKTGIQKSALSNYLKGDREPRQDQISLIADPFNINPAWLMGYDVPMFMQAASTHSNSSALNLSDKEIVLLDNYRALNTLGKRKLLEYSEDLMSNPSNIDASSEENLA